MNDTINLEALCLTPIGAMREAERCERIAAHFDRLANDPHTDHATAAQIRDDALLQAKRLRALAKPTNRIPA